MEFIGLRPFKILMDGDTICVYCPDNQSVFAKDKFCYNRNADLFTRLETDKTKLTHYEPHICLDTSDVDYPEWYVATSSVDFGPSVLYKRLGTVDWENGEWNIRQEIIGNVVFDVDLFTGGSQNGMWGTVSEDGYTVIADNGSVYSLSYTEEDIKNGYAPKPGARIRFSVRTF